MFRYLYRWLIGRPLGTSQMASERIPKWKALPIFSSDALSSVGYGPEQIAIILAAIPALGLYTYYKDVVIAIIILLGIVALSYSQIIKANPGGGGSYIIAKKYLGVNAALITGAALFSDYILTVAVSISSGTAAIISAFPFLAPYNITLDIIVLFLMMVVNLRGVKEASTTFVWPTYIFIGCMAATIIGGLYQINVMHVPPHAMALQAKPPLTAFTCILLLRAFANGCSSMTGVEAIADGVPMFKVPQERNAMITTCIMATILACMLGGISYLFIYFHMVPVEGRTLMSVLVSGIFGESIMFYFVQVMTMIILYLAANTAFNGLPPLLYFMSKDGYVPRDLGTRGDRLSFSNGIILLTMAAAILIVLFKGNVEHLISLYALGVFLSFTIAQSAICKHWMLLRCKYWRMYSFINGLGAVVTGVVVIIVLLTKFIYGAWIVVLLIPTLVYGFKKIYAHYEDVRQQLVLTPDDYKKSYRSTGEGMNYIVIPIASPTQAVARAIRYAKVTSNPITSKIYAVHIAVDAEKGEKVKRLWKELEPSIEMVVVPSPYRQMADPLITFIEKMRKDIDPKDVITVLIPEFETRKLWHRFLHNQSGWLLRIKMLSYMNVVVATVPLQFKK